MRASSSRGRTPSYQWDHPALRQQYRGWDGSTANHDYNWHDAIHTTGERCLPDSKRPCDDDGHGTHTMGAIVGDDGGVNQIGVAPGARWIGCRNMNEGVGTPATYIECFEFSSRPTPWAAMPARVSPRWPRTSSTTRGAVPPMKGAMRRTSHCLNRRSKP